MSASASSTKLHALSHTSTRSFGEKMTDWLRHILSCCDEADEEEQRPALQIGHPTNFRREDISIPGLDADAQQYIRAKARADAARMYSHLQPLRSSPSGQFADPNHPTTYTPSFEDFTTPRSPPLLSPGARRISGSHHVVERVRQHTRKISNSLTGKAGGYGVSVGAGGGATPYEMRALMEPSRVAVGSPAKLSGESYSVVGSDLGDGDSAKAGLGKM